MTVEENIKKIFEEYCKSESVPSDATDECKKEAFIDCVKMAI